MPGSKFPLGRILATPASLEVLSKAGVSPLELVSRHASGDWGELDPEDKAANEAALKHGSRILSAYTLAGVGFYVITDAEDDDRRRACTTVMLKSDY